MSQRNYSKLSKKKKKKPKSNLIRQKIKRRTRREIQWNIAIDPKRKSPKKCLKKKGKVGTKLLMNEGKAV